MNYCLKVVNIKSDSCANTIRTKLDDLDGVHETVVNVTNGAVFVDANHGLHDILSSSLYNLGYPEISCSRRNNNISTLAKSFVSCVKGRLNIA